MTVLTREQRIAWMAWHEFVHRGADYYRQVWGGKEWHTTLTKLRCKARTTSPTREQPQAR